MGDRHSKMAFGLNTSIQKLRCHLDVTTYSPFATIISTEMQNDTNACNMKILFSFTTP